ncbi:UNVERIFIED_CONTAM: hypothetical protein K2H54_048145 [Gekko kuhli]
MEVLCCPPAKLGRLLDPGAAAEPTWVLGQLAETVKEALARPAPAPRDRLTRDAAAVTALARETWPRPAGTTGAPVATCRLSSNTQWARPGWQNRDYLVDLPEVTTINHVSQLAEQEN